jgi:hypothetical protein
MRAAKTDANQSEIVKALRKMGATVQPLHTVGQGTPDLLVGIQGRNFLLEVKDGNKPPSAQKLTADQVEWHGGWRGQVEVVNSIDQTILAIQRLTKGEV